MPLDPEARALIYQMAAANLPPYPTLSPAEARKVMVARSALAAAKPEPVARIEHRHIPGPEGWLMVRLYTPAGSGPFPILVYLHGGGWVLGDLDTHDPLCRALANEAGCLVMSVEYRLAPEHRFPAALEDGYAAVQWAAAKGAAVNGDPRRVAVGGDSAGGNLAAAVALMARDRGCPPLAYQLLIYPITDYSFDSPSYAENARGFLLSRDDMVWYWNHHLGDEADGRSPYASPLRVEDPRGLPPALVITTEFDPLRDEGEAYAARLSAAGVPVVATRYEGMIPRFPAHR